MARFREKVERLAGPLLLSPSVAVLLVVTIAPFVYTVWLSLHNFNLSYPNLFPFVGFDNYVRILTSSEFNGVMVNSAIITISAVSLEFLFGLAVALLISREFRFQGIVRTLLIIPMMIAPIVVGLIFLYMFQYQYGVIDYFLQLAGLPRLLWLGNPSLAILGVILADVWQWTPFMTVTMLAGLSAIPKDLYEAASIDSASPPFLFRKITFPLLLPVISVALLFRLADSLRLFDLVYIITNGGPGFGTSTMSFYSFKQALSYFNLGIASTVDTILLIIMIVIANVLIYFLRRMRSGGSR